MKIYILHEDTVSYIIPNGISLKNGYCRAFHTMQAAINAMRTWKPSTFECEYKIVGDLEEYSRRRKIQYAYDFSVEKGESFNNMVTELEIKTVELE